MRYLLVLILLGLLTGCRGTPVVEQFLNLNFALLRPDGVPRHWLTEVSGYSLKVSSHEGQNVLEIRQTPAGVGKTGSILQYVPLPTVQGKLVRFRAEVRTEDVQGGVAGVWVRVFEGQRMVNVRPNQSNTVSGTRNWQRLEFVAGVPADATQAQVGIWLSGSGTAWFRNLELFVDDAKVRDTQPLLNLSEPQLEWLRQNSVALKTTEPGQGFADLKPLGDWIGNSRVVAVGESTHGTREFFRFKHRMLEYLVREKGFTLFAIEDNMNKVEAINRYVMSGEGDAQQLIAGEMYGVWATDEVLELIRWMRSYNQTARKKVQFVGFDMQNADLALEQLRTFARANDPDLAPTLDEIKMLVQQHSASRREGLEWTVDVPTKELASRVMAHVKEQHQTYLQRHSVQFVDRLIQNATLLYQYAHLDTLAARDRFMADNVLWLLKQSPDAKMMIWAHNGHVNKLQGWMGQHLGQALRDDYFSMGLGTFRGRASAFTDHLINGTFRAMQLEPAPAGSLENALNRLNQPIIALNLSAGQSSSLESWLRQLVLERFIGWNYSEGEQFFRTNPASNYSAYVFIRDTTASRIFPEAR